MSTVKDILGWGSKEYVSGANSIRQNGVEFEEKQNSKEKMTVRKVNDYIVTKDSSLKNLGGTVQRDHSNCICSRYKVIYYKMLLNFQSERYKKLFC